MSKNMTILELYKANLANETALFPTSDFNFMTEYNTNFAKYDKLFARNRHFFYYKDVFADETTSSADVLEDFQYDVNALLLSKKDSLQKIYDASLIEYNAVENYLMSEAGKDETTNTSTNEQMFGNVNRKNNFGADIVNNTIGEQTNTNVLGQQSNTTTDAIGERTDETKNGVSGYNTSNFTDSDITNVKNGAQSNSHSENLGSHTDITTEGERADVTNRLAREDVETVERGKDTQTNTQSNVTDHTFSRHGNIGVTTNQQMLQSEFDLRLNFNFYEVVFDLIIKELCNYSDAGFDAFLTPLMNAILEGDV